jgi:hypothetical protein
MGVEDKLRLLPQYEGSTVLEFLAKTRLSRKVLLENGQTVSDKDVISNDWAISDMTLKDSIHLSHSPSATFSVGILRYRLFEKNDDGSIVNVSFAVGAVLSTVVGNWVVWFQGRKLEGSFCPNSADLDLFLTSPPLVFSGTFLLFNDVLFCRFAEISY